MRLAIWNDYDSESPRAWDNLGTIYYKHGNYILGDKRISDPIDFLEEMLGISPKGIYTNHRHTELSEQFKAEHIALPVYLYDHGGQTISTTPFSYPWDSGQVGWIHVSKEKVRKEYGWKNISPKRKNQVLEHLRGEIKVFDQYIRGDVYGFTLTDDEGEEDSCGGFYGDDWENNGMKGHLHEEAFEMLKNGDVIYE